MILKRILRWGAIAVIAVIAFIFIINIVVVKTTESSIISPEETREWASTQGGATCIVVLGASVSEYGPSPMLADRLDSGLGLFALDLSDIMLLSGDNGTIEYNEVQAMKNYAIKNGERLGLTEENIYLDYAGFSTHDSMYRAKNIFQAEKIVIVTQRYHLYRALYIADRLGLDAVGVAAKDTKHGQTVRDIREIFARVKDFFLLGTGYVPKIMGDPVPLEYPSSQSSAATPTEELP